MGEWVILVGKNATEIELKAVDDLVLDFKAISGVAPEVKVESTVLEDNSIIIGCPTSSELIKDFHNKGELGLKALSGKSEGGSIDVVRDQEGKTCLVLAGIDPMGTQYIIYDFCLHELGIDPCSFWTGYTPELRDEFNPKETKSRLLPCPEIPIRCYFDNDNDELANMTKPYLEIDYSYWKELIDTLVRLKYNAIDFHDHLGRVEYTTREPYLKLRPGYQVNVKLLNKIIDYAKSKGMKIQVSFYLGWSFRTISDEAAHDWKNHKEEWLAIWRYYLKETPIGRSDIFLNRPRDQKLDHPFRSSKGETVAQVFNEAFFLMNEIIREHNPRAIVIADLYSEGREAFRKGFRPQPPEDYIMSWPDSGFGVFSGLLEDLSPYKAGIYMHAGFWRNHLVVDPYVDQLERSMKKAMYEYNMKEYCLVNGQTFRHFLLNLEACADICWYGDAFKGEDFISSWIFRYFGSSYTEEVKTLLQLLHEGQAEEKGYVKILSHISDWQALEPSLRKCHGEWRILLRGTKERITILEKGLEIIRKIEGVVEDQADYFHDHFFVPFTLLYQINNIFYQMLMVSEAKNKNHAIESINLLIEGHTAFRNKGDKNPKWKGWYSPQKARPNGGYPKIENV